MHKTLSFTKKKNTHGIQFFSKNSNTFLLNTIMYVFLPKRFAQKLVTEYLLCARCSSECWGYGCKLKHAEVE